MGSDLCCVVGRCLPPLELNHRAQRNSIYLSSFLRPSPWSQKKIERRWHAFFQRLIETDIPLPITAHAAVDADHKSLCALPMVLHGHNCCDGRGSLECQGSDVLAHEEVTLSPIDKRPSGQSTCRIFRVILQTMTEEQHAVALGLHNAVSEEPPLEKELVVFHVNRADTAFLFRKTLLIQYGDNGMLFYIQAHWDSTRRGTRLLATVFAVVMWIVLLATTLCVVVATNTRVVSGVLWHGGCKCVCQPLLGPRGLRHKCAFKQENIVGAADDNTSIFSRRVVIVHRSCRQTTSVADALVNIEAIDRPSHLQNTLTPYLEGCVPSFIW